MSKLTRKKVTIPTYPIGKAEELPMFFEKRPYQGASGRLYPIPFVSRISDEKCDRDYDCITLENDYIKVDLLPEIGGKIHRALDKTSDYDFIYHNKVIKPAMVGLAGPWVSGGIEFNWPQHHRPTTFMPVDVATGENGDEKFAYMGETDYFHRMKGTVKVSVDSEHSYIKAEITVYNSTSEPHPFMWWANLAVEVDSSYKVVFPPDVEYVNDHDRRAVLSWPVANGVYHTARPFNYGDGTDIHGFSSIKVPSSFMISRGQSDADFVCGYDAGKGCGVVTVANHHVAPGKKLWTWGDGKFGAKWCANLTDDGSKYVELMTGCYTDNQPDFTWIAPYETKTFEQYWYPVKDIGEVKCANTDVAINLEHNSSSAFIGVYSTSERALNVEIFDKNDLLFTYSGVISPSKAFTSAFDYAGDDKLTVKITDESGKNVLTYTEYERGSKTPIEPRKPALPPCEIKTNEELYLNGIHLVQYKHFAYRPEHYFLEALKRDPLDIRCNEAMGDISLEKGMYDTAIDYYSAAIKRLTLRGPNPYDTDPYYKRALCYFAKGELDSAYDDAYRAVWSYPQRCAGYYLLAKIDARKGNVKDAIDHLFLSLETNKNHTFAKYILGLITSNENILSEVTLLDPLFFSGLDTKKNAVNIAVELIQFGLYEKAMEILSSADTSATVLYYMAYVSHLIGNEAEAAEYIKRADAADWRCEFPARRETLDVLCYASTPMSYYYAGCILYNFERYGDAVDCFEKTVSGIDFAPAYRNLALGYFDHLDMPEKARECLEKAHELDKTNSRIFYELYQLYKNINLPISERLAFFEKNPELTADRDDCTLAYSVLCTVNGDYEKARNILKNHRFHTYEGGEGYLAQHHTWLQFLIGKKLFDNGEYEKAATEFTAGLTLPENYGEEKNYFVNEAPTYYYLALCNEKLGNTDEVEKYLDLADSTMGAPTHHSLFQCLALRMAGNGEKADALAEKMLCSALTRIATADVNDYYGVGAPAYSPFGYDIVKAHNLAGYTMAAFGYLASGNYDLAREYISKARAIDSCEFTAYLFESIKNVF